MLGAADLGLSRAGGAFSRPCGAEQHRADQPLPQRRSAGGDLRDRADHRRGGAAVRLRPHRSAPPQPDCAQGPALRQPARHDLRLRRLCQDHGPHAGARRLEGLQQAQARQQAQRQAARHRACQLPRDHQRRAARMVEGRRAARGSRRRQHWHAVERPRPRDEFRAMRRRMARRRRRPHQADPGRYRRRAGRRRLALRPLDAHGRYRDGQGVGGGDPEGHQDRRPRAGNRPGRRRVRRGPLHRQGHRPLGQPVRGGARGAHPQRSAGRSARPAGGGKRRDDPRRRLPVRLRGLRGRDRSRHRQDRNRALHRDRRRRPGDQSADFARPDPWRHRAGRRPGADGSIRTTTRKPGSCSPAR